MTTEPTTEAPSTVNSKENKQKTVVGLLVLGAALGIVLGGGADQVNKQIISAQLERFAAHVNSTAASSGRQAEFSYGNVSVGGSFLNRYATIDDVELLVTQNSPVKPTIYRLSTPVVAVVPDQLNARRVYYGFGLPITIERNDALIAEIEFSSPLKFGHLDSSMKGVGVVEQSFLLPQSITYTPLLGQARGQSTVISNGGSSVVNISMANDDSFRHAEYHFKDITITKPGDEMLAAAAFDTMLDEKRNEAGMAEGSYKMEIAAIKTSQMDGACDVNVQIDYAGGEPMLRLAGLAPSLDGSEVNFNDLDMECQDFSVNAKGKLAREGDDPLPSGSLDISITNANELLTSNLLSPTSKTMLREVLVKVTGQPAETLTNVDIPLRRTANGTFYIADVTFEEMAASLLKELLNLSNIMPPAMAIPMPPVEQKQPVKKIEEKKPEPDESKEATPVTQAPMADDAEQVSDEAASDDASETEESDKK